MRSFGIRVGLGLLLIALAGGMGGCFLDVYQTAATLPAGEWAFWWGFGARLAPGFEFVGFVPQLHVRYGLLPRLDVGVGTGFLVERDLRGFTFLGISGDLRYQLSSSPDLALGWMPGDFPFGGSLLSSGTLYLSQTFGTLTPYGAYRLRLLLEGGRVRFSHQVTLGVEVFNRPKVPAVFEAGWQDGRLMFGLAFRF